MYVVRRVAYRARVLTEQWVDQHAFLLGLLFGGGLTTLVLLFH